MEKEIWKEVKDYPDYEVSNLGRVKSFKDKSNPIILKPGKDLHGYLIVVLSNGKKSTIQIQKLVAIAFLNHVPCGYKLVINHIDFDRTNNKLYNLEIVTARENSNKKHLKSTSQYVGVSWYKRTSKWKSCIAIGRKIIFLGYFINEIDAHNAYQNKLKEIERNRKL